jgi:hypothetical protein
MLLRATVHRDGCHVIYSDRFHTSVNCAKHLLKISFYQTGTVTKKRTDLGASKMGSDKGFKRGEWEEIIRTDENLCILQRNDNSSVTA